MARRSNPRNDWEIATLRLARDSVLVLKRGWQYLPLLSCCSREAGFQGGWLRDLMQTHLASIGRGPIYPQPHLGRVGLTGMSLRDCWWSLQVTHPR